PSLSIQQVAKLVLAARLQVDRRAPGVVPVPLHGDGLLPLVEVAHQVHPRGGRVRQQEGDLDQVLLLEPPLLEHIAPPHGFSVRARSGRCSRRRRAAPAPGAGPPASPPKPPVERGMLAGTARPVRARRGDRSWPPGRRRPAPERRARRGRVRFGHVLPAPPAPRPGPPRAAAPGDGAGPRAAGAGRANRPAGPWIGWTPRARAWARR